VLTYIFAGIALLAIVFAVNCYIHLWKWARMCQNASIAIAYNGKVRFNATLVEWLTWCNSLRHEGKSRGRTVYKANKVSVSILLPEANMRARTTFRKLRNFRKARKGEAV
jgi:hypothetical protein